MPARAIFEDAETGQSAPSGERNEHLRLANILDQMPVGIGIFDNLGRLYHANRHFETAAGGALTTLAHMEGDCWQPVAHDGSAIEATAYPPARALNGQVATPGINFIRRLEEGREHWVAMSAVPLTAPGVAGVVGVVVVAENGESRRLHAEQLRAREERFQRFARHSSNALWIANTASGKIEYLSPAAARMWNDHQQIGTLEALDSHVHADDRKPLRDYRRQAVCGLAQHFEYRLADARGMTVRRVREICFPIPGEDGRDEDCIGAIVEDVSPEIQIYLVQSEAGERNLIEELSRSAKRIKHFVDAEELMAVADVLTPGCVIVDLRSTAPTAASIATLLAKRPDDLQIILIGSPDTAVDEVLAAMRAGAIDFLVEPFAAGALAQAINKAVQALPSLKEDHRPDRSEIALRLSSLPRREKEVLTG